jgi:putative endonuclease
MKLGPHGEKIGARFLKRLGHRVLKKNYRCPVGEIDLVTADRDTLVFVEVKTRRSDEAADPEAAVNFHKRRQITRVAKFYIAQARAEHLPARFDILSIVVPEKGEPEIEHFVNAFGPTPR